MALPSPEEMSMLGFVVALVALQQPPPPPPAPAPPLPLPPQGGDTSPFRRLTLPTPNPIPEGAGTPGPRNWQQRADHPNPAPPDTATGPTAWGGSSSPVAGCTRWRSGTRGSRCTTTCAVGTPSNTSARASSTSSTAISTCPSPCRGASLLRRRAR